MRYEINGGRVLTWSLEAHVVDHCNLRCEGCCTLSPHLPERAVPLSELRRDLERAGRVLKPNLFKLTGGEPLLHPDLLGCLDVAREIGIAEQISITTNGLLLARAPDALFERIDRMTLSHYSSAPLSEIAVRRLEERCAKFDVLLTLKRIDAFQQLEPDELAAPRHDPRTVHDACWLKTRCHLLHRGRFYTCTRPPHLGPLLAQRGVANDFLERDGIPLDDPELLKTLLGYLEADAPLGSCRHCLGASGPWRPHRQLSVGETRGFGAR